jgi:ubiquinone/menaquinone biosynthesis C-methylase UbiE
MTDSYVPALGLRSLTRFYDPVIAATMREETFKRRLLDQLDPQPGQRILDLGCGTGTLAVLVKERQPSAVVFGVDADGEMLSRAMRKADKAGAAITFEQAFAQTLPHPDESFDAVVSSLFFHHIDRPVKDETVTEIARVLVPGGELHVADWGPPSDPVMATMFMGIRLLDGIGPTADNAHGRLPSVFESAGLVDARERGRMRTMFGSLSFYSARKG